MLITSHIHAKNSDVIFGHVTVECKRAMPLSATVAVAVAMREAPRTMGRMPAMWVPQR